MRNACSLFTKNEDKNDNGILFLFRMSYLRRIQSYLQIKGERFHRYITKASTKEDDDDEDQREEDSLTLSAKYPPSFLTVKAKENVEYNRPSLAAVVSLQMADWEQDSSFTLFT